MSKIAFLLITIFSLSTNTTSNSTYDLKTALEKNLVKCSFSGNSDSPHYYQPLKIDISNLTNRDITIKIPNGLKFVSDSTDTQDLIITQEELIALSPNKRETKLLYAMCIEQNKSASNENTKYHIGDQSSDNIAVLTKEIERNKSFNTLGQYSIWALTDSYPINEIEGFNEKEANLYQHFVGHLLDIEIPLAETENYKTYYKSVKSFKRSVVGEFKYKFHKQTKVTIGLFNEQDIIVRELYNNPLEKLGEHFFNYAFDTTTYTDPIYYIRLVVNGEIRISLKMESGRKS